MIDSVISHRVSVIGGESIHIAEEILKALTT